MTQTPVSIESLLYTKPGFRQGRPCLAGTGVTVHTIAAMKLQGLTAEKIAEQMPDLDVSLIHAALAYYFANRAAIESDLESDRRHGEELARNDWLEKGRG